jgi:lycopene cyclase domain-containing protein
VFTYLLLHLFAVSVPVIRSFEKTHIYFAGKFRYLFPAMLITAAVFVTWDALFTHWGVWGFADEYVVGLYVFGLPIEEWLFFITIPYCCLFSYEVLNYFIKKDLLGPFKTYISIGLMLFFSVLLIMHWDLLYTKWVLLFNLVLLALVAFALRPQWLGRFYLMFAVILPLFILCDGILTGSFFGRVVVWYNSDFITEFRILTIPVEDAFYAFGMLLMNTALYEWFKGGRKQNATLKPE